MSKKRKVGEASPGEIQYDSQQNTSGRLKSRAQTLEATRKTLPIWPHEDEIREKLRHNDVLLLVGETGSGKSTQVPQFLYKERWCEKLSIDSAAGKKSIVGGCIAITQPRRVAAISLAKRVAEEVGTPLGNSSPASQVGYSVRFDNSTGPSTKIKFLTDGMLLQEMLRDPWLKEYSAVIVDEVHERGVNVDLALGFLKKLVEDRDKENGRGGIPLKVVVMSATADMEKIRNYFDSRTTWNDSEDQGDGQDANAMASPSGQTQTDEWSGFSDGEEQTMGNAKEKSAFNQAVSTASCFIKGRQHPVDISYTSKPIENVLDAAMDRITYLHTSTPLPGDILVFLSGQEMIENLESLCTTYASTLIQQQKQDRKQEKIPKLQILPLFAALSTQLQQRVFLPTPPFTRKIILSTDIAETSVTVSGVRHVIDTGKHKSRHFRPALNLDTLLTNPISRSSAAQRAGRAGREAPGTCYRLYTRDSFLKLDQDTPPEILQTDLSFLVLTLKSHGVKDVLNFPLLTPPPRRSLESALVHLLQLNALDPETGDTTGIGKKMSMLPLRPDLGRILLASTQPQYDCVDEIIDIVAGLSLEEGIWLPLHNRRLNPDQTQQLQNSNGSSNQNQQPKSQSDLLLTKQAKSNSASVDNEPSNDDSEEDEFSDPILTARRTLFRREGDHLTLLAAIQSYASPATHDRKEWCNTYGVSHRAMSRIMDVRKQLQKMIKEDSKGRFRLGPKTNDHQKKHQPDPEHENKPIDTTSKQNEIENSTSKHIPVQLSSSTSDILSRIDLNTRILKCLLTGLWPNIATLTPNAGFSTSTNSTGKQTQAAPNTGPGPHSTAPYTTLLTRQPLHIHPSSFLFNHHPTVSNGVGGSSGGGSVNGRNKEGKHQRQSSNASRAAAPTIMFTDFIYTAKPYARNVSVIEMKWMDELGQESQNG